MSKKLISIRSFIVQIGGGLLSLSKTVKTAKLGLHVVTGGLVFQQALIAFFLTMTIRYTMKLKRSAMASSGGRHGPGRMVHVLQASLMLITVSGLFDRSNRLLTRIQYRIIFRLVEFCSSEGSSVNNYIKHHEFFVYVFDAIPMFIALVLMNMWHPGKVLKERKNEKDFTNNLQSEPQFRMDRY